MSYAAESDRPSFEPNEEQWFSEPPPPRRPSQRPTQPAPAMPGPRLEDSMADAWFFDR